MAATLLIVAVFFLAGGSRSYAYYTITGPGALDWAATGIKVAGVLLAGLIATLLAGMKRLGLLQKMSVSATLLALAVYWIIATKERYASLTIAQIELGTAILASAGILLVGGSVCLLLGIKRRNSEDDGLGHGH